MLKTLKEIYLNPVFVIFMIGIVTADITNAAVIKIEPVSQIAAFTTDLVIFLIGLVCAHWAGKKLIKK